MSRKNNNPRPVKPSELNKIKKRMTEEATRQAFILMLCIPSMVIRDHFGRLTRLKVDGAGRETRFIDMCMNTYDAIMSDHVSYEELIETLKEETGLDLYALSKKNSKKQ